MILAAASTLDSFDSAASGAARASHVRPAIVLIRHTDFVACIDACVQALAGESADASVALASACAQLRDWLDGNTQILESGVAVDYPQFDAAILSIDERLAQRGAPTQQAALLRASRALAEAVYAGR